MAMVDERMTMSATVGGGRTRTVGGLVFALTSAGAFGLSGALGRGLMESGWSPGAAVLVRIAIGALVLCIPGALALRGRWGLLRRNAGHIVAYGAIAVAGCQVTYFYATQAIPVGIALLIEYTAPVAVVVWLWATGAHRPRWMTFVGGGIALAGLVLMLDLTGGGLNVGGVLWALAAMVGAATYFVMSADDTTGLPPVALAASGLVVGTLLLGVSTLLGLVPFSASLQEASYAGLGDVPAWMPLLALGVITAALAYATGIAAGRRLGSRVASFIALHEVLFAILFAWLLLAELPRPVQLLGGLFVLVGVVVVKLERDPVLEPSEYEHVA